MGIWMLAREILSKGRGKILRVKYATEGLYQDDDRKINDGSLKGRI
jgi:hypothetical protein